ncbi:MAG: polysaccharide biosynthesis/export family protein [Phycisphaerales bacterium]
MIASAKQIRRAVGGGMVLDARQHARRRGRAVAALGLVSAAAGLVGCETDSFFDPTIVGRWEYTPTVMPILDRLSAIEEEPADMINAEPIRPEDLIPEVEQYRFGPSDSVEIVIGDFVAPGTDERFQLNIDSRGYIYIPKLKPIRAQGLTNVELVETVKNAVEEAQIRAAAATNVSVNILSQRSQTYSVIGAVVRPDEYFIPQPNFRLLNALTASGGFSESIEKIYVIRQVPLSEEAAGRSGSTVRPPETPAATDQPRPQDPEKLIDIIEQISKPKPGMMRAGSSLRGQPESRPAVDAAPPAIDLPGPKPTGASPEPAMAESDWVYENGQWVKRGKGIVSGAAPGGRDLPVVTQRVIEVPTDRLIAGDASVNIVIRPGDVVRVPPPKSGVVYLGGQVSRPGPYGLGGDTKLTILRGMISAGGFNPVAIPERVDITRVVGPGRQATIRLNYRAIGEQTQPDIYLKPDDVINVGSNFWALPLAVVRGGFRVSYGYGFILDRNFAGDIFGADQSFNR